MSSQRPPSTGRTRNPRGHGDRLREEILAAGINVLDEHDDPVALTLRGTARRAGISAPAIYAHFADLPTLNDAVLQRSFDQLRALVQDASADVPAEDPAGRLGAAAAAYVRFGWAHRTRYRMMFAADGYAVNAVETFSVVESLVEACVAVGVSRSTDPHTDTWILWAGLHGVATLEKPARAEHLRLGTLDRAAMLRDLIDRLALLDRGPSVHR